MRYIIKETQYKRLIELMVEQETSAAPTTTGVDSGTVSTAGYGDISRVPGSELDKTASALSSGQSIILYKDKELKTRQGGYVLKGLVNNNGQIEADMGNFKMTTNCTRIPNDNSFDYGSVKYHSTELANMAAEKCKS
jgi:hypothetical protein